MKDFFTAIVAILTVALIMIVFAIFGSYSLTKALSMVVALVISAVSYVIGYRACQKDFLEGGKR